MAVSVEAGRSGTRHELLVTLAAAGESAKLKGNSKHDTARIRQWATESPEVPLPDFSYDHPAFLVGCRNKPPVLQLESLRRSGDMLLQACRHWNPESISVAGNVPDSWKYALAEGIVLGQYHFTKYISKKSGPALKHVVLHGLHDTSGLDRLNIITEAVNIARDMVNEPPAFMTAVRMAETFSKLGQQSGFKTEILLKRQLQSLKMGGLLSVNKGSKEPPAFTVMEYRARNAVNKKPWVLAGKGVSFDSGGLNIKTSNMEQMKCDMAGGAGVGAVMYAVARMKLPVNLVGLVPATDNRPGREAMAPGDVIRICDGTTVEVLNTDAEGRLILADALCYARRYEPEFIIDVATLTGAAMRAIGTEGIVAMGTLGTHYRSLLYEAGHEVHERLVEFPLWEEYEDQLKSTLADVKNIGGPLAGAITAGKFLERFTTGIPWMHLDIAGPSFSERKDSYRGTGGTGVPVRLLVQFIEKLVAIHGAPGKKKSKKGKKS